MKPECRRIEKYPFALHFLDHRPFRKHLFERKAARQAAVPELEAAQLGERVVFITHGNRDPVLRTQVAHEDRDDESVRLIAGHLHKAGRAEVPLFFQAEMAEVLHLEEAGRARAGNPRGITTPSPRSRERFELLVDALEPLLRQAVQPVVENSRHCVPSLPVQDRGRASSRARFIMSSCHGGAFTSTASRSVPAASKKSPRLAVSRWARCCRLK